MSYHVHIIFDHNFEVILQKSNKANNILQGKTGKTFFPSFEDHEQTFAYLFIDPLKRHATLLYHCWGRGLW